MIKFKNIYWIVYEDCRKHVIYGITLEKKYVEGFVYSNYIFCIYFYKWFYYVSYISYNKKHD